MGLLRDGGGRLRENSGMVSVRTSTARPLERRAVRPGRRLRVGRALMVVAVAYVVVALAQVWWAARSDGARPADAIVVLGAAQYDGRPSPVLQRRLDHVIELYESDMAPLIVVTGGRGAGDRYTEAGASATYLHDHGVPGAAVERETTGGSSYESLAATARFLDDRGVDDVVLVSDPLHSYRIAAISDEVGLRAVVSPTPDSTLSAPGRVRYLLRETAAVSLGRLMGYRRLDSAAEAI